MSYEGCRLPTYRVAGFRMGPINVLWRLQVANLQGATGLQGSGWAPLMCYEGCRLPTYRGLRGCRVQDGPHWCAMKAVGCQPTGGYRVAGFRMGPINVLWRLQVANLQGATGLQGSGWAPLMCYEGCRLPTYRGPRGCRVQDGPHWCAMKAVGCQPTGGYGVAGFRMGAPLMSYEGCRLPTYRGLRGCRVQDGPPLMCYEGCRLPTYRGYGFKMGPINVLWRL